MGKVRGTMFCYFLISLIPLIWWGGLGAGGVVEGLQAASLVLFIYPMLLCVLFAFDFFDLVGPEEWAGA